MGKLPRAEDRVAGRHACRGAHPSCGLLVCLVRAIGRLRVVRRLAIASLSLAWLCANGLMWDAMQMAAWGKMFAGYTETMSVTQALRETFDPAKPCEMCRGIALAKDATQKQSPAPEQQSAAKFVLALQAVDAPVFGPARETWTSLRAPRLAERSDPVPLPPPRA